jgi:hypothetical protein
MRPFLKDELAPSREVNESYEFHTLVSKIRGVIFSALNTNQKKAMDYLKVEDADALESLVDSLMNTPIVEAVKTDPIEGDAGEIIAEAIQYDESDKRDAIKLTLRAISIPDHLKDQLVESVAA